MAVVNESDTKEERKAVQNRKRERERALVNGLSGFALEQEERPFYLSMASVVSQRDAMGE